MAAMAAALSGAAPAQAARPKGWGPWKCGVVDSEGWGMRPGRGIVLWRFRAPDGREFDREDTALDYARSLAAGGANTEADAEANEGGGAAQQDVADDHADADNTAMAGKAILKSYTNTIPPKDGLPSCAKCRAGRGACRQPGAKGHLAPKGEKKQQLPPRPKKRAAAPADGVSAQSESAPPAKRPAPAAADQPPQPSVARSGRVRKAVSRWSDN
eukprot:COSAG03_NODE_8972_length_755_cov_1.690549_1_plen_213_part_10